MRRWSLGLAIALLVGAGAVAASTARGRGTVAHGALTRQCAREADLTAGVAFPAWHLDAVQFSSPTDGIGITSSQIFCTRATASSEHRQVTQLATTSNGGRSWQLTGSPAPSPGPRAEPEQLVATSPWTVWTILGNGRLVATTDQGSRWTPQSLPGTVGEIEQGDGSVWALSCVHINRSRCHPELWRTTPPGTGWSRIRLPRLTAVGPPQLAVLPRALVLAVTEPAGRSLRVELLHSDDLGLRWHRRPQSFDADSCLGDLLTAAPPASAWLLCLSEPGAGSDRKILWHSSDGGRRWQVASATTFTGRARGRGLPTADAAAFAASSPGRVWLAGFNGLVTSVDGGVRWSPVAGVDPEGAFSALDVLGPTDAWLLGPNSGLWRTTDGHRWQRIGPQNPG